VLSKRNPELFLCSAFSETEAETAFPSSMHSLLVLYMYFYSLDFLKHKESMLIKILLNSNFIIILINNNFNNFNQQHSDGLRAKTIHPGGIPTYNILFLRRTR
jgi:hypothetical protein